MKENVGIIPLIWWNVLEIFCHFNFLKKRNVDALMYQLIILVGKNSIFPGISAPSVRKGLKGSERIILQPVLGVRSYSHQRNQDNTENKIFKDGWTNQTWGHIVEDCKACRLFLPGIQTEIYVNLKSEYGHPDQGPISIWQRIIITV